MYDAAKQYENQEVVEKIGTALHGRPNSKGGFDHFMLKEIYDQPQCLKDCMSGRLFADKDNPSNNHIVLSALTDYKDRLMSAKHIIIVACGTSWHAALIGKQLIEKMCRKRVEVEYASEYQGLHRSGYRPYPLCLGIRS